MPPKNKPGDSGSGTSPRQSTPTTSKPPSRSVGQEKPADDNVSRPGKQLDESYKDYDKWFQSSEAEWARNMMMVLPEYQDTIRRIAWTYRFDDGPAQADALQAAGVWDAYAAKYSSGGSGSYRGGGGGGMSTAQQYAQAEATIRNQVRSMGVGFNDEQIKGLAKAVVDQNWSADMVTDYIVAGAGDWATVQDGQLTAVANDVRRMAAAQLIPISEETTRDYARRVASGELTQDGINSILLGQAKAQFSWLAPQLDAGLTVRDVLLPSRDLIARELEVPPETVDLSNTKWQNLVTVKEPTGVVRAATNNELVANARRTSEWQNTKGARDLTTAAIMRIRSMFYGD